MNTPSPKTHPRVRARELYIHFGPQVDDNLASRLRQARRRALNAGMKPARWVRRMVPASAFALAIMAAVLIWQPLQDHLPTATGVSPPKNATIASVLPPDADQTDPGMYQDLGFYAWLAQQPQASSAPRP